MTDEAYEELSREAEEKRVTVGDIMRERVEPKKPWTFTPLSLGVPKVTVSEWRELANDRYSPE